MPAVWADCKIFITVIISLTFPNLFSLLNKLCCRCSSVDSWLCRVHFGFSLMHDRIGNLRGPVPIVEWDVVLAVHLNLQIVKWLAYRVLECGYISETRT